MCYVPSAPHIQCTFQTKCQPNNCQKLQIYIHPRKYNPLSRPISHPPSTQQYIKHKTINWRHLCFVLKYFLFYFFHFFVPDRFVCWFDRWVLPREPGGITRRVGLWLSDTCTLHCRHSGEWNRGALYIIMCPFKHITCYHVIWNVTEIILSSWI